MKKTFPSGLSFTRNEDGTLVVTRENAADILAMLSLSAIEARELAEFLNRPLREADAPVLELTGSSPSVSVEVPTGAPVVVKEVEIARVEEKPAELDEKPKQAGK